MIQNAERFKNRKKAFEWLQQQGFKLVERSFYNACDAGFPAVAADKSLSRFEVSEFLRQHEAKYRKQPGRLSGIREDAETRKAVADAKKSEIQAQQMQRELDKKWISREESDLEVCTWACLTRDYITSRLERSITTLICAAGGSVERTADVQAIIDQAITDGCNDIANSEEVDVYIEDAEDATEET